MHDEAIEILAIKHANYVPKQLGLDDNDKINLISAIVNLLARSAENHNVELTEFHVLQALTYFKDYNINPLLGYIYYTFSQLGEDDSNLRIGAKKSAFQLVAGRSGRNAGNELIDISHDEQSGLPTKATATVKSVDPTTKKIVSTSATVYFSEVAKNTSLWRSNPNQRIADTAYAFAMRDSPMNDGSLSGLYLDSEMEVLLPTASDKASQIQGDLETGKIKKTKIKGRYNAGHKPN